MSADKSLVTFCGCLGQLSIVGTDPAAEGCLVWRTDAQLLKRPGLPVAAHGSLLELACDLAELYHYKHTLRLADEHGEVEVIWLELAADGSLLVFFEAASAYAVLYVCTQSGLNPACSSFLNGPDFVY